MIMETDRLRLRELTPEDLDALYAVLGDSDIMRHYPYTFDTARVENWIRRNQQRYGVFGFGLWAVCRKDTGELIGDCGITMQHRSTGSSCRRSAIISGGTASGRAMPGRPPGPAGTGSLNIRRFWRSILI